MAHLEKCLLRFGHLALGNVLVCLQLLRPRIEYIGRKESIFLGPSKHFHLMVSVFQKLIFQWVTFILGKEYVEQDPAKVCKQPKQKK